MICSLKLEEHFEVLTSQVTTRQKCLDKARLLTPGGIITSNVVKLLLAMAMYNFMTIYDSDIASIVF